MEIILSSIEEPFSEIKLEGLIKFTIRSPDKEEHCVYHSKSIITALCNGLIIPILEDVNLLEYR